MWGWHDGPDGWGWFRVPLLLALLWLARQWRPTGGPPTRSPDDRPPNDIDAMEIDRRSYARGELSRERCPEVVSDLGVAGWATTDRANAAGWRS